MTIYADPSPPFDCVICGRPQMNSPWDAYPKAYSAIAPICCTCEQGYGRAPMIGVGRNNRDHRLIRQVSALAEALARTAYCIEKGWEKTNAQ